MTVEQITMSEEFEQNYSLEPAIDLERKEYVLPTRDMEPMAGAGFDDWQRASRYIGHDALTRTLKEVGVKEQLDCRNPHSVIHDRLVSLELPTQTSVSITVGQFLSDPGYFLSQIAEGDYYFISILPGTHLVHGNSPEEVVEFVREFAESRPGTASLEQELYLSHNGEPVMSAHIVIEDSAPPNVGYIEATIGNFNAFHRGAHSPEIVVTRDLHAFIWEFRDSLRPNGDWRDTSVHLCNGGITLTRQEMVLQIYDTLHHVPHEDDYYLPGSYEVLFERTATNGMRPAFIEAVVGSK